MGSAKLLQDLAPLGLHGEKSRDWGSIIKGRGEAPKFIRQTPDGNGLCAI